jgi:hypothetical protein
MSVCVYPPLSLVCLFGVFTFIRVRSAQHERILLIIWYYKYIPFSSFHFFLSLRFSAPLIDNWKKQTRWKRKHRNANGRSKAERKRWPPSFFPEALTVLQVSVERRVDSRADSSGLISFRIVCPSRSIRVVNMPRHHPHVLPVGEEEEKKKKEAFVSGTHRDRNPSLFRPLYLYVIVERECTLGQTH